MRRLPVVLIVASLFACDSTGPDTSLVVATDRTSYSLAPDSVFATVSFSVTNAGRIPLEISRCGPYVTAYMDRLHASSFWHQIGEGRPVCPSIYTMAPQRLAPGETVQAAALLFGSGTYRLRVPHTLVGEFSYGGIARSNTFAIAPSLGSR